MHNLLCIKEYGITDFGAQQRQRMDILETMLGSYNDGRSKQLYCLAAALLSLDGLKKGLVKAQMEIKRVPVSEEDIKGRAKILKSILVKTAEEENEQLKLRKKETK